MRLLLKTALLISLATLAMPGWAQGKCVSGNCYNGYGVWENPDGSRYEGGVVNGKMQGKGVWTHPDGDRYEGDFVDGRKHGKGVYTQSDGGTFTGNWEDNKFHGKGVFVDGSGTVLSGIWEDDNFVRTDAQDRVYNECLLEKGKEQDMSVSAVLAAVQSVCQSIAVGEK